MILKNQEVCQAADMLVGGAGSHMIAIAYSKKK